jgi:hypothetical protein
MMLAWRDATESLSPPPAGIVTELIPIVTRQQHLFSSRQPACLNSLMRKETRKGASRPEEFRLLATGVMSKVGVATSGYKA